MAQLLGQCYHQEMDSKPLLLTQSSYCGLYLLSRSVSSWICEVDSRYMVRAVVITMKVVYSASLLVGLGRLDRSYSLERQPAEKNFHATFLLVLLVTSLQCSVSRGRASLRWLRQRKGLLIGQLSYINDLIIWGNTKIRMIHSRREQKRMQAPLPTMLASETDRTELSLKSYHRSLFLAKAVQWPPPSPPQWLDTAQRSQMGSGLAVMLLWLAQGYLGCMWTPLFLAYWAQEEKGVGSRRWGRMSRVRGKSTLDSFFYLRYMPFCLKRLRWRMSILGALQMLICLVASLCYLHTGQYHSFPAYSCSVSLKVSKQLSKATSLSSREYDGFRYFLVRSSNSFSRSKLKLVMDSLFMRMSSSQSFSSTFVSTSASVIVSVSCISFSNLNSDFRQNLSTLFPQRTNISKGLFPSMSVSQSSKAFALCLALFVLSLQASLYMNLSMRRQTVSPVVSWRGKKKGNLNQRFSFQLEQVIFLLKRPVSQTLSLSVYSWVSCTAKIILLSFYILETKSARVEGVAGQMPSIALIRQIFRDLGSVSVSRAMFQVHSSTLGLEQLKATRLVSFSKLVNITKQVKVFTTFCGMGRVTVMKGSKVMHCLSQEGQVTFDLYCPVIRSVMTDWLRRVWSNQLCRATSLSGRLLLSGDSTQGFLGTRLRSQWSPSMRKEKNQCESCCAYPLKMWLMELTALLTPSGTQTVSDSHHMPLMNLAQLLASLPLVPSGLVRLTSCWKQLCRKQRVRGAVLERHCRQLFMKQVLPRLRNPTSPCWLPLLGVMSMLLFSSSISAYSHMRRWNFLSFSLQASVQQATFSQGQGKRSSVTSQQPSHFFSLSDCRNHRLLLSLTSTTKKSPSSICRSSMRVSGCSFFPKPLMRYSLVARSAAVLRQWKRVSRFYCLSTRHSLWVQASSFYSMVAILLLRSLTVAFSLSSTDLRVKSLRLLFFMSICLRSQLVMQTYWQVFRQIGIRFQFPSLTAVRGSGVPGKALKRAQVRWVTSSKSYFYLRLGRRRRVVGSRRSELRRRGGGRWGSWLMQKSRQLSRNLVETMKQLSSSLELKLSWSSWNWLSKEVRSVWYCWVCSGVTVCRVELRGVCSSCMFERDLKDISSTGL